MKQSLLTGGAVIAAFVLALPAPGYAQWRVVVEAARAAGEGGEEASLLLRGLGCTPAATDTLATVLTQLDEVARLEGTGELRLTEDGFIPLDDNGIPDRTTLAAARSVEDRVSLLAEAQARTLDFVYQRGRNRLLETVAFSEPAGGEGALVDSNMRHVIETRRYEDPRFWVSSDSMPEPSHITGATSGSPLTKVLGPDARRKLIWPSDRPAGSIATDSEQQIAERTHLDVVRIAVNLDASGAEHSMEMFYKVNGEWEPFLFEDVGGTWVPADTLVAPGVNKKRLPLREVCGKCHTGPDGKLTPRVHFITTPEDLEKVGLTNPHLIRRLLED